jgi:hypothetical protein
VIDQAGDAHSLARRLDGVKAKDVRAFMADIDRDGLPSVAEARATQRSIERAQAAPELRGTAAEIRMAWSLTASGAGFAAAIEDRGLSLACVSPAEAQASETAHAFAKEIGRFAPRYAEGELVVVNGFGDVYRIDERSTGSTRPEIEKYLANVDTRTLLNVAETRDVMKESSRNQFVAERAEAITELRTADRADNDNLRSAENEAFWEERRERIDEATAARTEKWEAKAEADRARIDPIDLKDIVTKPALVVFDVASGVAESLLDFVGGICSGGKPQPAEFSSAESVQQLIAQRKALAAMENIRESMERGERLRPSDIQNLTPTHLENIKRQGDDYLRYLVEDLQRDRAYLIDYGRTRER